MTFKKKHRGYDPAEVDKYIEKTAAHEQEIRVAQKERIDELTDENYTLRQQLKKYQEDEEAISQSLIASQNLAQKLKFDAEKYSDIVLTRAKIFYATWRAYAQTLISSLSPEEVTEFNKLQRKIEDVINAYEGKDIAKEVEEKELSSTKKEQDAAATVSTQKQSQPATKATASRITGAYGNPIAKVEQAADQVIDLNELIRTDLSLEELCDELGLTGKKGA